MGIVERANHLFAQRLNWGQAVLAGCGEPWGLDQETALRLARVLGSGMSSGDICGAVSGAGMVLAWLQGPMALDDPDTRRRVKELNREFQRRFRAVHGTLVCRELLGVDSDDREAFDRAIDKGLFKARCGGFVATAAEILEQMLGPGQSWAVRPSGFDVNGRTFCIPPRSDDRIWR